MHIIHCFRDLTLVCALALPVVAMAQAQTSGSNSQSGSQQLGNVAADTDSQYRQASTKAQLTFMDSKLFDAKLGKELESGKEMVEVAVSGRMPLNNIPPRMDRWLVKSAEEGRVELLQSEPVPKTRSLFSFIPLVFDAVSMMKNYQEEKMLDQAKKYDTKIFYKKDDQGETLIEKVVMTKRK